MNLSSGACCAALLCCPSPAAAQIPAYPPAQTDEPPSADPAAIDQSPAPAATTEAAPAPPPDVRGPSLAAPAPAKAVVIAEHALADAPRRDEADGANAAARTRPKWYGWQTLVMDGATLSLFISAAIAGGGDEAWGPALVGLGLVTYELGPGIIHFAHGNPGRGFASMGVRLGLPLAGAFVGASVASGCDGFLCEAGGAVVGALLGVGGAVAIDAAIFAYEDPERTSKSRIVLRPLFSITHQRAVIGLAGEL